VISQECKAKLKVGTNEKNSIITINNEFIGNGNIVAELKNGIYFLTVSEPFYLWNPKRFYDTVNISNCTDVSLSFNFHSVIYLNTDPQDAYVYSKDSLVGHTPLFVPKGIGMVSISKPGYSSKTVFLNKLPENNTVELSYIGQSVGERFYEKSIFKILIGSIVALGGVTAYFKLKADNRYDSYMQTSQKNFLDETRKYDLISGITMGALQINFGILIYYFLTD
jgi:hypothetical protein